MEAKNVSFQLTQTSPIGLFFQDTLLLSLFLMFFREHSTVTLPYIFLTATGCLSIILGITFSKIGYNRLVNIVLSTSICAIVLLFETPVLLYIVLVVFVIWRIEERYTKRQVDQLHEGSFILFFVVLFTTLWFLGKTLLPFLPERELISILIVGMLFYIGNRLITLWLQNPQSVRPSIWKVSVFYSLLIGIAGIVGLVTYYLGEIVRINIVTKFEGVIKTVLTPLGYLLHQISTFFSQFYSEEEFAEAIAKAFETSEPDDNYSEIVDTAYNTQYLLWIAIIAVLVVVIILIVYFVKSKKREARGTGHY